MYSATLLVESASLPYSSTGGCPSRAITKANEAGPGVAWRCAVDVDLDRFRAHSIPPLLYDYSGRRVLCHS